MYIKRTAQLKLLEEQYALPGNNLVILYGRKGMGKTTILSEFLEDKPEAYYYEATECVDKLQLIFMKQRLSEKQATDHIVDYSELFSEFIGERKEKTIIVIDEFHFIMKNSESFVDAFKLLGINSGSVMFVLCSSSIRWVENEMISSLGNAANYITSYMKLKEFTFVDFVNHFPNSSVETCIQINAVLGGVPEYLRLWKENQTVADNIRNIILDKNCILIFEPQHFLKMELRETSVYNTILSTLAEGNRKLNDLHQKTGFSRAKILVYLKHLIQLDLIEKLVPLNEEGKENVQKGIYRIKDNFLHFWYRFVFPNLSELMREKASSVYDIKIAPYLDDYVGEYFSDVCAEFLKLMNLHQRLPEQILWWDRWYGKNGTIDILAQGDKGNTLLGKCLWKERKASESDYEELAMLAAEAGKKPDYCYIFSKGGFTEELRSSIVGNDNIKLIGLEDL